MPRPSRHDPGPPVAVPELPELPEPPPLPGQVDLVVVGAGLMGCAAAWSAVRRGLGVVLLEQFALGHDHGSSHGSARIVRRAYPDAGYARMAGAALELWRELEVDVGEPLVRTTGGLDHGEARDVPRIAATLAELGVAHELLDAAEATRRWPGMVFAGPVLHHPDAGTLDAAAAVRATAARVRALGGAVADRTRVRSLDVEGGAALVHTDRGTVRAARVVVAAGPWVAPLLREVTGARVDLPPLAVTQQQVFHFPRRAGVPEWPVAIHEAALSTYSLPGGRDGGPDGARKVAEHGTPTGGRAPTTAEERSGAVDPEGRRRVVELVQRWLPGLEPEPFAETTCLYTSTSTEDFVLDRVGPLVVCSPCSGHGAKFAPLVGQLAVDLAVGATASGRAAAVDPRFRLAAHAR